MENQGDYVTKEELEEGLSLLHGDSIIQFEKPSEQIIETKDGYEVVQSLGWVKFSAAFRNNMLEKLKGARLGVFISICLHVNEGGVAFPGVDTIAKETGYNRDTVMTAIAEMEGIPGLLQVFRERGKSNKYRPAFVAKGAKNSPIEPVGKSDQSELSPLPVQKIPTTFDETSPENIDSNKKLKNIKKIKGAGAPKVEKSENELSESKATNIPELQLFRSVRGRYPKKHTFELVIKSIKKVSQRLGRDATRDDLLPFWEEWASHPWSPDNLAWLRDWAVSGIIPARPGSSRGNFTPTPQSPAPAERSKGDIAVAEIVKARRAAEQMSVGGGA